MKFSPLLADGREWGKFRLESQGKAGNPRLGSLGVRGRGQGEQPSGREGTGVNVRD